MLPSNVVFLLRIIFSLPLTATRGNFRIEFFYPIEPPAGCISILLVKEDFNRLYICVSFSHTHSHFLPLFIRGPLQAVYMFYALALVCDDYFVPSLEKICEVREGESAGASKRARLRVISALARPF